LRERLAGEVAPQHVVEVPVAALVVADVDHETGDRMLRDLRERRMQKHLERREIVTGAIVYVADPSVGDARERIIRKGRRRWDDQRLRELRARRRGRCDRDDAAARPQCRDRERPSRTVLCEQIATHVARIRERQSERTRLTGEQRERPVDDRVRRYAVDREQFAAGRDRGVVGLGRERAVRAKLDLERESDAAEVAILLEGCKRRDAQMPVVQRCEQPRDPQIETEHVHRRGELAPDPRQLGVEDRPAGREERIDPDREHGLDQEVQVRPKLSRPKPREPGGGTRGEPGRDGGCQRGGTCRDKGSARERHSRAIGSAEGRRPSAHRPRER